MAFIERLVEMLYVIEDPKADKSNFTPFAVIGGDHHIHAWKYPDPETRIYASASVLQQGIDAARAMGVPLIVNGDLTHDKNSLDPLVTAILSRMFSEARTKGSKIILNIGNHERPLKFHSMHTLACFEPVVDIVASDPRLIRLTPPASMKAWPVTNKDMALNILLVPFYYNHKHAMADIELHKLLNKVPAGEPLIFVGHYPVDGAEVNGIKPHFGIKLEDFLPTQFEALLFNDIHKAQPISDKAYHLGCTHQNTFGEQGYKYGWWAVGLWGNDPRAITIARLPTTAPEFFTGEEAEVAGLETRGGYVREKPTTVISRSLAEQGAPRIEFTQTDLGGVMEKYLSYQVSQGMMLEPMKAKMKQAVAEIMRPAAAPGAR
jgi:DNA repair exonuclease SbcCD nuclease subunit